MEEKRREHYLERSPTRCPYCHDDLVEADLAAAVVCVRCLSRHHPDCWQGACASCGEAHAVGRSADAEDVSPWYERAKHAVNWSYMGAFALSAIMLPLAFVLEQVLGRPELGAFVAMLPIFLTAGISMLMWALNSYDAAVRRDREPSLGPGPLLCASSSPLTGGLTGFLYYVLWGRRPLPGRRRRAPPPPPSPRAKA